MTEVLRPDNESQVQEVVASAAAEEQTIALRGGGSKAALGRPGGPGRVLDLSALSGVSLYEPEELILSAGAGTPLAEIEATVAQSDQRLAFEPADLGPLLGGVPGLATLACNLSGPRRFQAGAARDHFLGVKAVSGRGQSFKSGGRVVKNVTGYDLCKLLAGSYGTLAVMTEVTIKVLPAAEKTRTVLIAGLDDAEAVAALGEASRTTHEPSGLAHLPAPLAARSGVDRVSGAGVAVTAVRIEGPASSVEHRCAALREAISRLGPVEELHSENSRGFWQEVRDVAPFAGRPERVVWRLSVPPARGAEVVARIAAHSGAEAYYDWAGGLIWLSLSEGPGAGEDRVRAAVAEAGGHALLVRAPDDVRASVSVFQPQPPALAALTGRVKDSFDPRRVLNPGRMYEGV